MLRKTDARASQLSQKAVLFRTQEVAVNVYMRTSCAQPGPIGRLHPEWASCASS